MAQEIAEQLYKGRVRLKALIEHEGKVLIVKNVKQPRWEFPGGRLHIGEDIFAGLAREVYEELGIEVIIKNPIFADVSPDDHFAVVYQAALKDPRAKFIFAPDEVSEVRWVTKGEVPPGLLWDEYQRALEVFFKLSDK